MARVPERRRNLFLSFIVHVWRSHNGNTQAKLKRLTVPNARLDLRNVVHCGHIFSRRRDSMVWLSNKGIPDWGEQSNPKTSLGIGDPHVRQGWHYYSHKTHIRKAKSTQGLLASYKTWDLPLSILYSIRSPLSRWWRDFPLPNSKWEISCKVLVQG